MSFYVKSIMVVSDDSGGDAPLVSIELANDDGSISIVLETTQECADLLHDAIVTMATKSGVDIQHVGGDQYVH